MQKTSQNSAPKPQPASHTDLDFMIGSWVDDPAFDEAIENFEVIDETIPFDDSATGGTVEALGVGGPLAQQLPPSEDGLAR